MNKTVIILSHGEGEEILVKYKNKIIKLHGTFSITYESIKKGFDTASKISKYLTNTGIKKEYKVLEGIIRLTILPKMVKYNIIKPISESVMVGKKKISSYSNRYEIKAKEYRLNPLKNMTPTQNINDKFTPLFGSYKEIWGAFPNHKKKYTLEELKELTKINTKELKFYLKDMTEIGLIEYKYFKYNAIGYDISKSTYFEFIMLQIIVLLSSVACYFIFNHKSFGVIFLICLASLLYSTYKLRKFIKN